MYYSGILKTKANLIMSDKIFYLFSISSYLKQTISQNQQAFCVYFVVPYVTYFMLMFYTPGQGLFESVGVEAICTFPIGLLIDLLWV